MALNEEILCTPWHRDVTVGERALTTTGGRTWDAAHRLCDYLEASWTLLNLPSPPHVLELGAGTGWLGMTLARNVGAAAPEGTVILTEQPHGGAMEWLNDNIELNRAAGLPLGALRVSALDWTDWTDFKEANHAHDSWASAMKHLNLILGSDLVYSDVGVHLLPKVFRWFLYAVPGVRLLYSHTLHRYDHLDLDFFEALHTHGLAYRAVAADGIESPPEYFDPALPGGEEFLQELFPEQRIVVYQVLPSDSSQPFMPWCSALSVSDFGRILPPIVDNSQQSNCGDLQGIVQIGCIRVLLPRAQVETLDPPEDEGITLRLLNLGPFGSGEHPTTALMLGHLQELQSNGRLNSLAVCDYGCGSGILGLAAIALGAARCTGIDIIPEALDAAFQNAQYNGDAFAAFGLCLPPATALDSDLDFYARYGDWRKSSATKGWMPLPADEAGAFDLIVANIVVGPLCRSAKTVKWLAHRGSEVLLAGIREGVQTSQVYEAYGDIFELKIVNNLDGWVLVHGTCVAI